MKEKFELLLHFIVTLLRLLKPGGVKIVMAETMTMKQQLIVMKRGKKRSPKLTTYDRFVFGFLAIFIGENRLRKVAVIVKPATILRFHKALVKFKYTCLYSNKSTKKRGPKGPDQDIINAVIAMKQCNPRFGYLRISMQLYEAFRVNISPFAVGRILRKHHANFPSGDGPSWLTFIGHMKDSLWSVDLFRSESILLKSHWIMVVLDQYTRRIIGFAVHASDCDGITYCCLLNKIISGHRLPKFLRSDNDPLFLFHRWKANLRVLDIDEIKSIPGVPTSHPFVERVIGSVRREYLDHMIFFNKHDLQNKLNQFQLYYNESRAHSSLEMKTPKAMASTANIKTKIVQLNSYRWKSFCKGLYNLPIAA